MNKLFDLATVLVIERKADWGNDTSYAGFYRASESLIVINMRKLRGHTMRMALVVLGHEMRHAVQYKNDWLQVKSGTRFVGFKDGERIESNTWKGELISRVKYIDLPWEMDAQEFQVKYAQDVIDAGIVTQEQVNVQIPGSRLFVRLEHQTMQEVRGANSVRVIDWFTAYAETTAEYKARRTTALAKLVVQMEGIGVTVVGNRFVGGAREVQMKAKSFIAAYKTGSKRKIDRDGSFWMALDQMDKKFSNWSQSAVNYAFANHLMLMQSQYVTWNTRELDIDDFVC